MLKNTWYLKRLGTLMLLGLTLLISMVDAKKTIPQARSAGNQNSARRASEAADRFVARFHETLDFGVAFDEQRVTNPVRGLRNIKFFENALINGELVRELDDTTLMRLYKAMMNVGYLGTVYNNSVTTQKGACNEQEVKLPEEINLALKQSRFANPQANDNSGGEPFINTGRDLEEYITLLNRVGKLYRKHLPQNVFSLPAYKRGIAARDQKRSKEIIVLDGDPSFGITKGTKVYLIQRDLFVMYWVEENGEMKVFNFGIGN